MLSSVIYSLVGHYFANLLLVTDSYFLKVI